MKLSDLKVGVSSYLFREKRGPSPPLKGRGFLSQIISLEPKVLRRAKIILGSLLLILILLAVAGIYQAIASKDFEKITKPLKDFWSAFEQIEQSVSTAPVTDETPPPAPDATIKPNETTRQTKPASANCIRKNIREGEFASNKCYPPKDYEDLEYYLGKYNTAVFERDSQEAFIKVTCAGQSDMFKESCEEHKQKKSSAESEIEKYKTTVLGIIAKG